MATPRSPRIADLEWGRLEVAGGAPLKDAKLFPGGAREWDWNETGTHHVPGVQVADVEELVEHGAEVVVLARGFHSRLEVPEETVAWLEERGVEVRAAPTDRARQLYAELRDEEKAVGALFHTTC